MSFNYSVPSLNGTAWIPIADCTVDLCSLEYATVDYDPTLVGNTLYLAIFAVLLCVQAFQGITNRTWTFMGAMIGGMILEIIGYAARIQMHYNPFLSDPFLMYIICLTIAPTFFSAAIYLCLARIVVVYGEAHSRFRPRTYTLTFISCDFFSLVLQAVGGALADTAKTRELEETGVHIMVAGLSFQVASLLLFAILCAEFAWRVNHVKATEASNFRELTKSLKFRAFLFGLAAATLFILIRSCFRVAELSDGFGGKLANDEVTFMILEGAMIISATLALTAFHPGKAFAGNWVAAGYSFRTRKAVDDSNGSYTERK